jgi:hypothetical protein
VLVFDLLLYLLTVCGVCVVLSAPVGWLLASASRRGMVRIPRSIVSAANALYVTLVAAPIAFIALFALLVGRAWFAAGHTPTIGQFDARTFGWIDTSPDPREMPIHAWTVIVLLFASHAAVVLLAGMWPILRVERGESLRKIARVFVPGYALVWAVILSQPFYFDDWFIGSISRSHWQLSRLAHRTRSHRRIPAAISSCSRRPMRRRPYSSPTRLG